MDLTGRSTPACCGPSRASPPTTTSWPWCAAAASTRRAIWSCSRRPSRGSAQSRAAGADRCRIQLRRLDQVLQAGRERPNAIVSYYAQGRPGRAGPGSDHPPRDRKAKSLDDVMRALWERHGKPGIGVPGARRRRPGKEVTGLPLDAFFEQALDSTEDLDLAGLLATTGVELRLRSVPRPEGPRRRGVARRRKSPRGRIWGFACSPALPSL